MLTVRLTCSPIFSLSTGLQQILNFDAAADRPGVDSSARYARTEINPGPLSPLQINSPSAPPDRQRRSPGLGVRSSSRRFLVQQQGRLRLSQHRCRLPPPPGQTSLRLLYSAVRSRVLPAPAYYRILRTLAHKRGPFPAAMEPGRASDALPQKYGAAFF